MTFELQKDVQATLPKPCTSFAALGQKKRAPQMDALSEALFGRDFVPTEAEIRKREKSC
jgi:hypothetical protein